MGNEPYSVEGAPEQDNNLVWWLLGGAGIFLVCCVAAVLVIGALTIMGPSVGNVFSQINQSLGTPGAGIPSQTAESADYPQAKDNALGDSNAPVKIVEFGDFQCPYCAHFWRDTEKLLIKDYVSTGKVYFVYRSYGAFIGPESERAAEAAYCAGEQGRFWEYHDILYENQGAENSGTFADDKLLAFAGPLGLDVEQFGGCLRSKKYESRVRQDASDAKAANVQATPTFVLNDDKLIEGAQPYDVFVQAIEAILAGQ